MKKVILVIAVTFISAAGLQAQKKAMVSIAVNAGIPTTTGYSFAVGGDLQADFAATEGLKITVSGGYENFSLKSSYGSGSFGIIPLLAGAKFNLGSEKLYGHAQLGYGVSASKGGGGSFAYAPSIGYYFSPNFDGAIKYMGFDHFGVIGVRLAYNF
ncbi:MAG: hypothetical protein ABI472_16215 [Ginsengibacter sp.]